MAQNFHVYNESQEEKLKAIVIVIDNYDAIREVSDTVESFIQKAARDGAERQMRCISCWNSIQRTARYICLNQRKRTVCIGKEMRRYIIWTT